MEGIFFITTSYIIQFMIEYLANNGLNFAHNKIKEVVQKEDSLEHQIFNVLDSSLRESPEIHIRYTYN